MSLEMTAKRQYRRAVQIKHLIRRELKGFSKVEVPLTQRMALWRRGFLGEAGALYGFDHNDPSQYLSDYAHYVRTPFINYGRSSLLLDDKLYFYYMMNSVSARTPAIYGIVDEDRVMWIDPPPALEGAPDATALLKAEGELVLKPIVGGSGIGISFVSWRGGGLEINGEAADEAAYQRLLAPSTLISERVHQAEYAERISPYATNTLRIVTMWDHELDEPFIAAAVHRFGTSTSKSVDNWRSGGISADLDIETGEMGPALAFPHSGRLEWLEAHPETGVRIQSVKVPGWADIRAEMLRIAGALSHIVYIGWDVVVTDEGPSIIEGNAFPSPNVVQAHRPLLADERVREFYRHHGII